jgi:hypothetical protein
MAVERFLEQCAMQRRELSEEFGFDLRGRVIVYLFVHRKQIAAVFGDEYAGAAYSPARMIVLSLANLAETLRHELAHLFAARWNPMIAPLFQEGLATHLQGKVNGKSVDMRAFPHILDSKLRLTSLLQRSFFFRSANTHACYLLAGSFTGFLVRRFGWKAYRRYYRGAHLLNYKRFFIKCFGVSLVQAEWQWRDELMKAVVENPKLRRSLVAGWDSSLIKMIF